jgi:hypothetical protein
MVLMTTVDIAFRYGRPPEELAIRAVNTIREVYGIRRILFDEAARQVRVEYDATRLNAAIVEQLLRRAGLDLVEKISLIPPAPPAAPAVAKA